MRLVSLISVVSIALTGACDDEEPAHIGVAMNALDELLAATPPAGRTPGTNQAIAELVRAQFRAVGIEDVTIEEFSIPVSSSTNHSVSLSGPVAVAGMVSHQVNVFGGAGTVRGAEIVDVGLAAVVMPAVAGKVALLDFSVTRSLRTQYRRIIDSGAIGALIDSKIDTLRQRNVWSLTGATDIDGPIPIVTIEQGQAAALREQLVLGANVRVDLATDAAVVPMRAYNVIARIPGTTYPERTLLINGHLDSWFAGAADDGQAIAALVALGKVLNANPLPYTVELVAFDCEETFLLGSNNYIMRRLPTVRDTLIGAISFEMLAPKTRELSIVTVDPRDVWLPPIEAGGLTELFNLVLTPADQMTAFGGEVPSDQGNFWQFGVPGFFVVSTYNEYHTIFDDAQNTDEVRYAGVLTALERTIREVGKLSPDILARRPGTSIDVRPVITDRTNTRVRGTISTSNAQSAAPVEDARVTITAYNEAYDTVVASAQAVFVAGTGYKFQIDHAFGSTNVYQLSFDAVVEGRASGRALLRLD